MALAYKSTVPLKGLAVPIFGFFLSVLFELSLQLTALLKLSLSLGISLTLPTIAISLALVAALVIQFDIALGFSLPSLILDFAIAIDFELILTLGLIATLEALIAAIIDASLVAYGWFGSAADLGSALTSQLADTWPDGTDSTSDVTVVLFVATVSGPFAPDQVESLSTMPKPDPPPAPQHPPPPDGAYPPPQAYTNGLASVVISPPSDPHGTQATGSVTVDDSVSIGIGAITDISIGSHGTGYTSPPTVQVTDTADIVAITAGSPVILTLPRPLTIPIGQGLAVTVGDVTPKDLNGQHFAKVTAPTTVELYSDAAFSHPVSGSGTGGTVTGSGQGAAALVTMGGGAQQALKTFFDGMLWPNVPNTLIGKVLTFRAMLATIFNLMIDLDGNLNARANLLGSIKLNVGILPPSISASLELLAKIAINLRANLEVALPDLTIALAASLDAQISAIADLVAKIGFFLGMGSANLEIWEYTGPGSGLGAAIASGPGTRGWRDLTPATTPVVAGIFGLTNPASATAFRTFFPGA